MHFDPAPSLSAAGDGAVARRARRGRARSGETAAAQQGHLPPHVQARSAVQPRQGGRQLQAARHVGARRADHTQLAGGTRPHRHPAVAGHLGPLH